MKINQYEFLREGKPFEPTREEIIQFTEHELQEKDKKIKDLETEKEILKRALLKASKEAFGNKVSFISSDYPKKITNSQEYADYLMFIAKREMENGNK